MDAAELDPDPVVALREWLAEAEAVSPRPDAMLVATSTADGRPSARVVLLRRLDEQGLVFFTNRTSRKGGELAENPRAAVVFHWPELGRQVRVEGDVEEVARDDSEAYWQSRPRASRIAGWVSRQSQPIADRAELEARYRELEERFADGDVPLPDFWGGYRVVPTSFEFWTHRENRLHDRVSYVRTPDGWQRVHLAP